MSSVLRRRQAVLVIAVAFCALACTTARTDVRIPVEVWRGGDDGLTIRLTEAIESALRSSLSFVLSAGARPGTVVLQLPTHVAWEQVGSETEVRYRVELSVSTSAAASVHSGSCKESALTDCAKQVVAWAEATVKRP